MARGAIRSATLRGGPRDAALDLAGLAVAEAAERRLWAGEPSPLPQRTSDSERGHPNSPGPLRTAHRRRMVTPTVRRASVAGGPLVARPLVPAFACHPAISLLRLGRGKVAEQVARSFPLGVCHVVWVLQGACGEAEAPATDARVEPVAEILE